MIKISRIIGISGTRDSHEVIGYPRVDVIRKLIRSFPQDHSCMIVAGGASGVDTVAISCARDLGMAHAIIPYYRDLAHRGGFARNETLVDFVSELYCFWNFSSPGTRNAIGLARKAGKLREVYNLTGESVELVGFDD